MKNSLFVFVVLILVVLLSSCGVNNAFVANTNQNITQVHLASNNYKVVERLTGRSEVSYVLIFGGMNQKKLYENAYADMMNKANLMSDSRALINIVTEEHIGGVPPFYYTRTVRVSAHVIEFTE